MATIRLRLPLALDLNNTCARGADVNPNEGGSHQGLKGNSNYTDIISMTQATMVPESFSVDHRTMSAPQVRKAGVYDGPAGDRISKFDLRFVKPNVESLPTAAIHTLEHLLATYLRDHLDTIDVSPMGCRTGFYLSVWGDITPETVKEALLQSLHKVLKTDWKDVPGISEKECGNYRDHSLFSAKEFARQILEGFSRQ